LGETARGIREGVLEGPGGIREKEGEGERGREMEGEGRRRREEEVKELSGRRGREGEDNFTS
jgi:hypothetical protein